MSHMLEYSFTDLLEKIVDNRGRTCPTADSGLPLIATNCIQDDHLYPVFERVRYVDEATHASWFRGHPEPNDIIFVCKGSPGRIALVPDPVSFCIAQDMVAIRADTRRVHFRYLYYALKSPAVQAKIANMHVGSMIPHFKKGDFGKLRFAVHENLDEQQGIAEVLGALDEKIAANTKFIAVVGEALDATFASICGHPEQKIPFGELATITKGVSYRSADLSDSSTALVTLKSFDRNGGYSLRGLKEYSGPFKPAQQIAPGELAVAQTDLTQAADVVGRAVRVPAAPNYERLVASLDLAIVRPSQGSPVEFLLGVMLQGRFRAHCRGRTSGTTVLHLASDAIPSFQAPLVSQDIQENYASVARPMLRLRDSLEYEMNSLASTRDALLPQLMSGKLRVKDAEKVLEDAGV